MVDAPALGASNIGADGMLGIDSLRSQRVMFDFKAKTMSITPSSRPVERLDGDDDRGSRPDPQWPADLHPGARSTGSKMTVIVDTGSQVTIGNMALQRIADEAAAMDCCRIRVMIESVTGEKMSARVAESSRLELGDVQARRIWRSRSPMRIFSGSSSLDDKPALLLGMNAMRAFDRISIDFANEEGPVRPARNQHARRRPVGALAAS